MTTVDWSYQNRRQLRSYPIPHIRTCRSAPLSWHVWHGDLFRQPGKSCRPRSYFKHRPRRCPYASRPRFKRSGNIRRRHAQFPGRVALGNGVQWVRWSPGVSKVDAGSYAYHHCLADTSNGTDHCASGTVGRLHRALVCRLQGNCRRMG